MSCLLAALLLSAAPTPKQTLQKAVDEVRQIIADKAPVETKQRRMKALTHGLVEFDKVAEETLGNEWPKMTPKQRKEFSTTLEQLVEASYLSKVSEATTVDLTFTGEDQGDVEATAKMTGADVHMKFSLQPNGQSFWVRDVEIDDVSLVRNYRSQFAKVIAKSGVKDLQQKIQRKVAELRSSKSSEVTPTAKLQP